MMKETTQLTLVLAREYPYKTPTKDKEDNKVVVHTEFIVDHSSMVLLGCESIDEHVNKHNDMDNGTHQMLLSG